MCIICVSKAGIEQPTEATIKTMFETNPHGAGYMFARNGFVVIRKGFMTAEELINDLRRERFSADDAVVYHFRISTQAGTGAEMTHPFPLTRRIEYTRKLDLKCKIGVAHNGIIRLTSDARDKVYSDTAHYIAEFMCWMVRCADDLRNPAILDAINRTTSSKWALMDESGYIATVGNYIEEDNGLLYSNGTYKQQTWSYNIDWTNYRAVRNLSKKDYDKFMLTYGD